MLSIPAGALLIFLVLLSSVGILAWLFPTQDSQ